jgi:uncharacterized membrane-anchored protein YhcB (DUF1043 family)
MWSQRLVLGLILGLFVGSIIGIVSSDFITGRDAKISELEARLMNLNETFRELRSDLEETHENYSRLVDDFQALSEDYISLSMSHEDLLEDYSSLEAEHEASLDEIRDLLEMNQSYTMLLKNLDMAQVQEFKKSIDYNISAGTSETWEFYIEKLGLTWEASIFFTGDYVSLSHSWQRGEERVFVGSSGRSLTYKGSPDIPYYGYQDHLWGDITVQWYRESNDSDLIWVTGEILSNLPTIIRGDSAYIDTSEWDVN